MVTKFLEKNPVFKSDYEIAYIQHGKGCGTWDL